MRAVMECHEVVPISNGPSLALSPPTLLQGETVTLLLQLNKTNESTTVDNPLIFRQLRGVKSRPNFGSDPEPYGLGSRRSRIFTIFLLQAH